MMKKILAVTGLAALAAVPAFAFAKDGMDDKGEGMHAKVFDKTVVSIGIANDGGVLIRGAKVTDVDSSSVAAETVVNGVTMTWAVDADGADVVEADGDAMALADVSEGDYISFSGKLSGSMAVDASVVRDWSVDATDDGDEHDNGIKAGFWQKFKGLPFFSFFGHAKADIH